MAAGRIVVPQYSPARDRNDRLVAGAKLYVYTNGTTTPASIFSDSGLTTPMANPVVANASGAFASIWASDAVLYTVAITGASGESIGNPAVFDDYSVTVDWFAAGAADASATAAAASATAAAGSATAAAGSATTASGAATTATGAATTATTQATNAASSATSADTDADRAEAAANIATGISNMYATTAAGLAATASGGYFSVEPDTSGVIRIYRDDAGSATEVGAVLGTSEDHKGRLQVPPILQGHRSQGLKLRKALSDIRAGTRKSLKIMAIGDSLVGVTWSDVHIQMMKELEGWMTSTPVYAHSLAVLNYGTFSDTAAASAIPRNYTGTYREKLDYDAGWDGTLIWLESGQASNFSIGGLAVQADKIYIPIITEPGAGSVKIEISNATTPPALGGSWSNPTVGQITSGHSLTGSELIVSANAAFGVEMVTLSVALGSWTVKVTHSSGGKVRVRHLMHEVSTAAAFNVWRVGTASNDFTATLSTAATIEAEQIAAYDPDIIIVESDDRLAAYQNFLPLLETAITGAGLTHDPLVLLVINPFYDNAPYTDADIIERADYCHNFAATRLGWDVLDGMAMSGGLAEATAAGYENDGIHYSGEIARWMTRTWLASRGYLPSQPQGGGYADRAVALKGPVTTSTGSQRPLIASNVPALLLQSTAFDTTTCAWAGAVSGSASYARGNAGDITLATGATGSSGAGAYINQNGTLLGINQGNVRAESRGFAVRIRTTTAWDAQALAFILQRTDAVAWNSGYNGTLTANGWGFRISNDGTNTLIHGICWTNGALVASATSATLPTGAASTVKDLAVLLTPESVNSSRGTLEWFVGAVSLGTSNYDHSGVFLNTRVEITNGSTATNRNILFMPPKYLSAPQ
jgi:hypothetical protein